MDDVDIGLFDYDRNNTLFYFAMNADEQIYLRYGGRDQTGPDAYLNLNSIELALQKGLDLHKRWQQGQLPAPPRPPAAFPRQIPLLVERTFSRNNCVECHLIGDFQNTHRELDGTLDKRTHMFKSPDLKTIGITLDIPKGLLVKEARDQAQAAGIKAGDVITAINSAAVYTFADLQYLYDKVDRAAKQVALTVERDGKPVALTVALPVRWWYTDIRFRQYSIDPRVYFESQPLTAEEKQKLELPADGFASKVSYVDRFAEMTKAHELKVGDVISGVDGVVSDPDANTAELYVKLRKKAGDEATLDVIRDGKRFKMPLKTYRMSFRK